MVFVKPSKMTDEERNKACLRKGANALISHIKRYKHVDETGKTTYVTIPED